MSEHFTDVILFAVIAIFLVLKLGSVLGKKTGHQDRINLFKNFDNSDKKPASDKTAKSNSESNILNLSPNENKQNDGDQADNQHENDSAKDPLTLNIEAIQKIDPSFETDGFIAGATKAFEWILQAYVDGNGKVLKSLLSQDVYNNFANEIRQREKANLRIEDTLVGINHAEILDISLNKAEAQITVKIISDQVNALIDSEGKAVEGDPNKVVEITDIWTFTRDLKSGDPNWILTATRSLV